MNPTEEKTNSSPCKTLEGIGKTTDVMEALPAECSDAASENSNNVKEREKQQHLKELNDGEKSRKSEDAQKVLFEEAASATLGEHIGEYEEEQPLPGSSFNLKMSSSLKEKMKQNAKRHFCPFLRYSRTVSPTKQATMSSLSQENVSATQKDDIEECEKKQALQEPQLHVQKEFSSDEAKLTEPEDEQVSSNLEETINASDESDEMAARNEDAKLLLHFFHLNRNTDDN